MATIPSIAMIPSGYKANKVYSVLPTDGSGDLDNFARTTKATRVNSDGLIEEVAIGVPRLDYTDGGCPSLLLEPQSTNLITQSEAFDNAYWTKSGAIIQGDASTAGVEKVVNGDFTNWTSDNPDSWIIQGAENATNEIKQSPLGSANIISDGGLIGIYQDILTVGKLYKITVDCNAYTSGNIYVRVGNSGVTTNRISSLGSYAFYATCEGNGELFLTRGAGSVNLSVDNLSVKEVQGFSAPSVDSPLSAFKLVEDTSNGGHQIQINTLSVTDALTYTFSANVKQAERSKVKFILAGASFSTGGNGEVVFDISEGTVISEIGNATGFIESLANGFYKISITKLSSATGAGIPALKILNDTGTQSYTGDGTSGVYIFASQLEAQSSATSYIPTAGTTITRTADSASKSGISSLIGQTEGTIFLDSKIALNDINNSQLFSINNGGGSDTIRILTATGNRLRFIYQLNGGVLAYSFYSSTGYGDLTSLKIAFTYKSGDIKVYINGVLVDSSTNTFTIAQTLTDIDIATIAGGYSQMFFNDIRIYKTALSSSELTTLTTL